MEYSAHDRRGSIGIGIPLRYVCILSNNNNDAIQLFDVWLRYFSSPTAEPFPKHNKYKAKQKKTSKPINDTKASVSVRERGWDVGRQHTVRNYFDVSDNFDVFLRNGTIFIPIFRRK